jgi:hypothetical protein
MGFSWAILRRSLPGAFGWRAGSGAVAEAGFPSVDGDVPATPGREASATREGDGACGFLHPTLGERGGFGSFCWEGWIWVD